MRNSISGVGMFSKFKNINYPDIIKVNDKESIRSKELKNSNLLTNPNNTHILLGDSKQLPTFKYDNSVSGSKPENLRRMTISNTPNRFTINNLTKKQSNNLLSKFKIKEIEPTYLKEENKKLKFINKYLCSQLNLMLNHNAVNNKTVLENNEILKNMKEKDLKNKNKQLKLSKTIIDKDLLNIKSIQNQINDDDTKNISIQKQISKLALSNNKSNPVFNSKINSPDIKRAKLTRNEIKNKTGIVNQVNNSYLNSLVNTSNAIYDSSYNKSPLIMEKSFMNFGEEDKNKYTHSEQYFNLYSSSSSEDRPEIDLKGYNLLDKIYNKIDDQAYMENHITNNSRISKLLVDYIGERKDQYQRRKSLLVTNKSNKVKLTKKKISKIESDSAL